MAELKLTFPPPPLNVSFQIGDVGYFVPTDSATIGNPLQPQNQSFDANFTIPNSAPIQKIGTVTDIQTTMEAMVLLSTATSTGALGASTTVTMVSVDGLFVGQVLMAVSNGILIGSPKIEAVDIILGTILLSAPQTFIPGTIITFNRVDTVVVFDVFSFSNIPGGFDWSTVDLQDYFIMFAKDNSANLSSITGYYASVKLKNNSIKDVELFSIGSDITVKSE